MMSTTTQHWSDQLLALGACKEAYDWALTQPTAEVAWQTCERGDWMLWIAGKCSGSIDTPERKLVGLAACGCARLALPYTKEPRVLKCIEVTEAYCRGDLNVTLADVRKARQDAYAVAYAADAVAYAAVAAADAVAYAAVAAAVAAAYAAAYAADAADAADARKETLKKCADIVRQFIPNPPTVK
jgi:hypothetical protein